MRQLKKSECAILPLVLKKKWYDLIDSGKKKEEYREDKPYWDVRLRNWLYKAQKRRYYQRHRAEILAQKRRYYVEHQVWERRRLLFLVDSTAYANYRAAMRIGKAKRRIMGGNLYKPRFNRRIQDWATFGKVVWASSPFLAVNLTPAQRDFARCLNIERKKARET